MLRLKKAFSFSGKVIHGEKVGRTIGFPTANLDFLPRLNELERGVYFGHAHIDEKTYPCLAYFGPRYIFGEEKDNFEVYLYEFNRDLYGKRLFGNLDFFIRSPKKIQGLAALQKQLEDDKKIGLTLLQNFEKKIA